MSPNSKDPRFLKYSKVFWGLAWNVFRSVGVAGVGLQDRDGAANGSFLSSRPIAEGGSFIWLFFDYSCVKNQISNIILWDGMKWNESQVRKRIWSHLSVAIAMHRVEHYDRLSLDWSMPQMAHKRCNPCKSLEEKSHSTQSENTQRAHSRCSWSFPSSPDIPPLHPWRSSVQHSFCLRKFKELVIPPYLGSNIHFLVSNFGDSFSHVQNLEKDVLDFVRINIIGRGVWSLVSMVAIKLDDPIVVSWWRSVER